MKKRNMIIINVLALSFLVSTTACSTTLEKLPGQLNNEDIQQVLEQQGFVSVDENGYTNLQTNTLQDRIATLPTGSLSEAEKEGLLLMREEEKLAHDVYLKLYEKWSLKPFTNISNSEQTHTDAIKVLLDKYELSDPNQPEVGVFKNPDLQALFTSLANTGQESLIAALKVGATIEDLDIKDLQKELEKTSNEDIRMVYEELMRGSRNHMRAFIKNLKNNGGEYTPQYITQAEFDAIISADIERGANATTGQMAGSGVGNGPQRGLNN